MMQPELLLLEFGEKKAKGYPFHVRPKGKKLVLVERVHILLSAYVMEKMNGAFFANFMRRNFKDILSKCCNPNGHLFVQDGDPSQNSKVAKIEMNKVNAVVMAIPPRSPDLNPIENVFHVVKKKLGNDAIDQKITHETFVQFSERVKDTLLQFPTSTIDNIINSMPKRLREIVKRRGERLRY